jgi:CBS domain-containing protein
MIKELMTLNPVQVSPQTEAIEIARLMSERNVGAIVVEEKGKPVGIVTDRDLVIRCVAAHRDAHTCRAETLMSRTVVTCSENAGVMDCVQLMRKHSVRRVVVTDSKGAVRGIVSFGDLAGLLAREFHDLTSVLTRAGEEEATEKSVA